MLINVHGRGLAKVLAEFIRDNQIKMLALLSHKQSLLERMFMKSNTRELVFDSSIPILVLPGIEQEER